MKNNTIRLKTLFLIMFILSVIFISFIFIDNKYFALLLSLYISILVYFISNYKNHMFFICFLLCFFIFLLGRPIVFEILDITRGATIIYDINTRNFTYICLLLSLIFLVFGYIVFHRSKFNNIELKEKDSSNFSNSLLKVTKIASILLYLIVTVENILRLFFVKDIGYTNSYALERTYQLPFGLHSLTQVAPIAFCLFLASYPSKKEAKSPIFIYILSNIILAMSGNRFEIISSVLLIIIYCFMRNKTDNEIWIKKKHIILLIIFTPCIILLMQYMIYWREGNSIDYQINPFINFFSGVGGSSDLISATYRFSSKCLSSDTFYSFGNLWRNFHSNIFAKIFGAYIKYDSQSIAMALDGHSLSSALTFYLYPQRYLSGYGLGGCYIAELVHDFSFIGVVIGNFIIGVIISKLKCIEKNKIFLNFCSIFMILFLLRLPRDSFDYFIVQFIGVKNVVFFVFLIFITTIVCQQNLSKK